MQEVLIFADGASKGNPGPGGWGALVSFGGEVRELGGKEKHTTNNRMELTAAIEALNLAHTLRANAPAVFHTDSSYVINGITKWVAGWQKRGWVTQKNEPVLNRDLWEALAAAVKALGAPIGWEHVGGHVGVVGNERADQIASDFAEGKEVQLYAGSRRDYPADIENISHDKNLLKQRAATKSRSSAKAYSYVSSVDGIMMVHKTWAECEARVRGKKARFKKAISPEEEAAIIKAFS